LNVSRRLPNITLQRARGLAMLAPAAERERYRAKC
jgi:hypothetical protein